MFGFLKKKEFDKFVSNDFGHLRRRVDAVWVALLAVLGCVVATLIAIICTMIELVFK